MNIITNYFKIDISKIKDHFWVYLRFTVVLVLSVVVSVTFTHLAPKEVFGQYNLLLSLLSIFSLFSMPGLNNAVLQSTARGYDGSYKIAVKKSFLWSLVGIPIIFITGLYYYYYVNQISGLCLIVACIFFPFLNAPNTWDGFLQGKERFDLNAKYAILQSIVTSFLMIAVLFVSSNTLFPIFLAYLSSNAVITVLIFIKSLKYVETDKKDDDSIKYGYFLTASNVIGLIGNNIDKILIGMLLGPIELATYTIATNIPLTLKDLTKYFWAPITPKMCQEEMKMINVFEYLGKKFLIIFLILIIVGSLFYWFFIGDIILLLFGQNYADSIYFAKILIIMVLLSIPTTFLGAFCMAKKNKKGLIFNLYIYPFVKIVVTAISIYYYGLIGAVWGLNLCWLLQLLLTWFGMGVEK